MERIRTVELAAHVGQRVHVAGWLHARRRLGGLTFLTIRDGWGLAQVVAEGEEVAALDALEANAPGLGVESVVAVEARVTLAPRAPGGLELVEPRVEVISRVSEPPPVALNKHDLKASLTTLLESAAVTNRHPTRRAVFRLAAAAMAGFRETLLARDFTEIQTPKLVAAATESGANVFHLDYFGRDAYLAQSPQLYKQMMVGVFERVFEVGPVFRAEPHDTTRHINEYVSLDAEMGFIQDHRDVMALLRDVLAGMLAALRARGERELALLDVTLPEVPPEIPAIAFTEAQDLIFARHGVDVRGEPDLSPQDERWLGEWAWEAHGSDFLYVTGYPTHKRAFYTHPDPARPAYTNSFDLMLRGMELVSGGQRLHRYEDYRAVLAERGLPLAPFRDYLEAMRYGMPPHGGFGLGLERLLMQLTGLPTIKLVALFPRDLTRLTP
ncbi:MAG: aspartate--tRNA(Asn) ligase [Ktedonobacterales bacterium]|nr:aspartate--tRNA(Asn) ligase [Ktedonobacterales bacterium]